MLRNLDDLGMDSGPEYRQQKVINGLWNMFLKDLANLADNNSHDNHSKK